MSPSPREPNETLKSYAYGQVIQWVSKTGMGVTPAIFELVDNGFDADAGTTRVNFNNKKSQAVIADDGRGAGDVRALLTPYQHVAHDTTQSGMFGVGAKMSIAYLANGTGRVHIESNTKSRASVISMDYGVVKQRNEFCVHVKEHPNDGKPTGTTITIDGCRKITGRHVAQLKKKLCYEFAPALRAGKRIVLTVDGKEESLEPFRRPALSDRVPIDFVLDGYRVTGFCGLVMPGHKNPRPGWSFARAHRFIETRTDPLGEVNADLSRIYAEVFVDKSFPGINDHKSGWVEPNEDLMRRVGEESAPVIERARLEGSSLELKAVTDTVQGMLDRLIGRDEVGVKEKRRSPRKLDEGAHPDTGNGPPRVNLKNVQPGDHTTAPLPANVGRRRILIHWQPSLETNASAEVKVEARCVRVLLNENHPAHAKYLRGGKEVAEFLLELVLSHITAHATVNKNRYHNLFPDMAFDDYIKDLDEFRSRVTALDS